MTEIRSLKIGLSTQLANGSKVFGVLSEDSACTCFDLTAPDGGVTRFALTDDALAAMVDVSLKLRERNAGVQPSAAPSLLSEVAALRKALEEAIEREMNAYDALREVPGSSNFEHVLDMLAPNTRDATRTLIVAELGALPTP